MKNLSETSPASLSRPRSRAFVRRNPDRRYRYPFVAALFLAAVSLVPAFAASVAGPQGSDIPVTADGFLACPAVAMGANGDFEVVWNNYYCCWPATLPRWPWPW
jgi:hypothetical protein